MSALDEAFARLEARVPGLEARPAQREMAARIAAVLEGRGTLLVEAGTGTGKSLAYLLPTLLSGRRTIVSTGTRALQEQLVGRDLPLVERALDHAPRVAVLKGLSNYLCLRRYAIAADAHDEADPRMIELETFRRQSPTGDRAGLPWSDGEPLWLDVRAQTETRLGARCPFNDACFVTAARRLAHEADVLVVNHHLFFADLALRRRWPDAQLLPAYDAVVFDEAHQLEAVATEHLGLAVSSARVEGLARDLGDHDLAIGARVSHDGAAFFAALRPVLGGASRIVAPADLGLRLEGPLGALALALARAEGAMEGEEDPARARLALRARSLAADLTSLTASTLDAHVHWIERRARTIVLGASPVEVGAIVGPALAAAGAAVVLTSATLATSGKGGLGFLRGRLGLPPEAEEAVLPSPFDFATQALTYLPAQMPDPADPEFPEAVAAEVRALCERSRGGAFVLFTTHRNLEAVARRLEGLPFPRLVQGDLPAAALLEAFRARRDAVLLATAGFWEGVDVPGDALRLVVIDKLPFSPPDDPLESARAAALRARGLEPFRALALPRAILQLKQGFGRLVRTAADRGVVALLDPRLATRPYGKAFLDALPPAPRTRSLDDVASFFAPPPPSSH